MTTRRPYGDRLARPARSRPLRLRVVAAVAAGGAIGAPLRYEIGLSLPTTAGAFPLSTFVVNVSGSLLLGLLLTLIVERWPPTTYVRPFAAIGVLGAYTTWSTFMVDTDQLVRTGRVLTAGVYLVTSMVAGLAAASLGVVLGRRGLGGGRRSH